MKFFKTVRTFVSLLFALIGFLYLTSSVLLNYKFTDKKVGIPGYNYRIQKSLVGWEDPRLQRGVGESDLDLSIRLTTVVSNSFYHCSPDRSAASPLSALILKKLSEKWAGQGILAPQHMRCGFCHQTAYVLAKALIEGGVRAIPWGLNGHVVTKVEIDDREFLFDPDQNILLIDYTDYDIDQIKLNYQKNSKWNDALAASFLSKDDDGPYSNFNWLKEVEKEQTVIIKAVYEAILDLQAMALLSIIVLTSISGIVIIVFKWLNRPNYRL